MQRFVSHIRMSLRLRARNARATWPWLPGLWLQRVPPADEFGRVRQRRLQRRIESLKIGLNLKRIAEPTFDTNMLALVVQLAFVAGCAGHARIVARRPFSDRSRYGRLADTDR